MWWQEHFSCSFHVANAYFTICKAMRKINIKTLTLSIQIFCHDNTYIIWFWAQSWMSPQIWWSRQSSHIKWAQVEWWLEHRHGWLVKRQWVGSWLGRVTRDEYQVLGSTSIPARLDTLVYRESFSWLTSVGTTRNTVNRLGWSRIRLAVLILNAAGAGLIGRPAVISGRYNKCHSLQLQNHYAHFPPLQHTHIHARHSYAELVMANDHGFRGIVCWPWQEESCVIG